MDYKVIITADAEDDLRRMILYLIQELHNEQAASNLLTDFEETVNELSAVAGNLKICENTKLKKLGYRKFISEDINILCCIE